jgi:hypothetical protein
VPKKYFSRANETSLGRTFGKAGRFLNNIAPRGPAGDIKQILYEYRNPAKALISYNHAPRVSRVFSELNELIVTEGLLNASIRDRVISQFLWLKLAFPNLPKRYVFYPREHVLPGGSPYDEEYVRVENFGKLSTDGREETYASGFATFDPKSGVFSTVGYSMGTEADVRAGPIITIETKQEPADISLTANVLLDYQYQLSANSNPAFQPGAAAISTYISFQLDLLIDVEIQNAAGDLLYSSRAIKRIKHAELKPESTLPPYIAGTEEIVSGTSLHGSEISVPVIWDYDNSVPSHSRVHLGVICAPFVIATGYRGSHDYKYLGIVDGRASGQVTSVQALVFT